MRRVTSRNTAAELYTRRTIHRAGFRYRLHCADLPGKPDMALPRYCLVVFINGCFWHGHFCRRGRRIPNPNTHYWLKKMARNKSRDQRNRRLLRRMGSQPVVVWECHLEKDTHTLLQQLRSRRSGIGEYSNGP